MIVCIYHNKDLDGFCSGAIVKRKFPDAVMIGYDYGEPFSLEEIPEGAQVIMVDVSMPMNMMCDIGRHSGWQFTWIDHHKSAIEEYEKYQELRILNGLALPILTPVHKVGVGACELAWEYFFPEEEVPQAVTLLSDYDVWKHNGKELWNELIYPFQMGMRTICNSLESFPMNQIDNENFHMRAVLCSNTVNAGRVVVKYQAQYAELLCRSGAFEAVFEGLNAICLNAGGLNSNAMNSVFDSAKHDVIVYMYWQKSYWKFSIYTKNPMIDVSVIAKEYGGGGHKGAAGFECKRWLLADDNTLIISKA